MMINERVRSELRALWCTTVVVCMLGLLAIALWGQGEPADFWPKYFRFGCYVALAAAAIDILRELWNRHLLKGVACTLFFPPAYVLLELWLRRVFPGDPGRSLPEVLGFGLVVGLAFDGIRWFLRFLRRRREARNAATEPNHGRSKLFTHL